MKTSILSAITILLFITACNNTFEIGIEHSPPEAHGAGWLTLRESPAPLAYHWANSAAPEYAGCTNYPRLQPRFPGNTSCIYLNKWSKSSMIAVNDNGQSWYSCRVWRQRRPGHG